MRYAKSFLLLAMLLATGPAAALSSDKDQPIQLEADAADIDENTKLSVYRGNVVLTQGSIRITADKLEVHGSRSKADKIVAYGNPVTFFQKPDKGLPYKGRSQKAVFHTDSDRLHLIDKAVLAQGDNRFASDRIIYNRKKALMHAGASAEGKRRVSVTINPNQ